MKHDFDKFAFDDSSLNFLKNHLQAFTDKRIVLKVYINSSCSTLPIFTIS